MRLYRQSSLFRERPAQRQVCLPDRFTRRTRPLYAEENQSDAQAELEKQLEKEAEFKAIKAKFFGLIFSDGRISIRVLESVQEIIAEGQAMHHYAQYTVMCSVWKKILFPNQIAIKH